MSEFDEKFPRGSVKTDSNEDKKLYLKANPGLLELKRTAAGVYHDALRPGYLTN